MTAGCRTVPVLARQRGWKEWEGLRRESREGEDLGARGLKSGRRVTWPR